MRVEDSEVDPQHDAYLAVIGSHSEPVGDAMLTMSRSAGTVARTLDDDDLAAATRAMENLSDSSADFLHGLSQVPCPAYLRGAHDQLEGALRRIVRQSAMRCAAAKMSSLAVSMFFAAAVTSAPDRAVAAAAPCWL